MTTPSMVRQGGNVLGVGRRYVKRRDLGGSEETEGGLCWLVDSRGFRLVVG